MTNFTKISSEIRINGRVAVGSSAVVLGKVRFFDESYTEGCILCVRGDERVDRETLLICPPIAVIVFCEESAVSLGELCSLGVPCLVLNESEVQYESCKNKVALIDSERGIVMLNPSIDTLEIYSSSTRNAVSPSLECDVGIILKDIKIKKQFAAEYYLVSASELDDCDAFEASVELWESLCPELLLFDVCVPNGTESSLRHFCERIEELYRAALYGSFAISLSGFDCESELAYGMQLLHKTFCMLEAEGIEFNGYLPRGITLSSPLWLMRSSPVTNPDFLLFDLDTLLPSLFSLSVEQIIKKEKNLKKELFSVFDRYFANFAPHCDIFLKTERFFGTSLLRDLVRIGGVKVVFS